MVSHSTTSVGVAARLKLVICDVDGVMTGGSVLLAADDVELKDFDILDEAGIHILKHHGIQVGLLSGRRSGVVARYARDVDLAIHHDAVLDKKPKLLDILDTANCAPEELCYIGDDIVDIPCMLLSGFPVAVANARDEVKKIAAYITRAPGGSGAIREVAELILRSKGAWDDVLERFHS